MQNLFQSVENTSASTAQMSAASTQMAAMISDLTTVGEQMLSFVSEMDATTRQLDEAARLTVTPGQRLLTGLIGMVRRASAGLRHLFRRRHSGGGQEPAP